MAVLEVPEAVAVPEAPAEPAGQDLMTQILQVVVVEHQDQVVVVDRQDLPEIPEDQEVVEHMH